MSRKCSHLSRFLSCFSGFAIDFIMHHDSLYNKRLLHLRFYRAIALAAANHFRTWRLTLRQLWKLFTKHVIRRIMSYPYHPSIRNLIRKTLQREDCEERPAKRRKLNRAIAQNQQSSLRECNNFPIVFSNIAHDIGTTDSNIDVDAKLAELPSDDSLTRR